MAVSIAHTAELTEVRRVLIHLHPRDNIALARVALPEGLTLAGTLETGQPVHLTLRAAIPAGHKIALANIGTGEPVYRYGELIGVARQPIFPGEHVHTHNLDLSPGEHQAGFDLGSSPVQPLPEGERRTFLGYPREDGRVGTRNYIVVLPTVNCAAHVARRIAGHFSRERLAEAPNVNGVIALTHDTGCSMRPNGLEYTWLQRTLAGIARHPNVGGCVLVGLGCEVNQLAELMANYRLGTGPGNIPVGLVIQELGGTAQCSEPQKLDTSVTNNVAQCYLDRGGSLWPKDVHIHPSSKAGSVPRRLR